MPTYPSSSKPWTLFHVYRYINNNVFTREIILLVFVLYLLLEKNVRFYQRSLLTIQGDITDTTIPDSSSSSSNSGRNNNHLRLSNVPESKNNNDITIMERLKRPQWITNLITIPGKTITFRKFTLKNNLNFYFPEESVMHSAEHIIKNEVDIINYFFETVRAVSKPKPCYIVDVGTNGGFYTLLGRTLGCYVFGIDAQPHCIDRLYSAIHVNGYSNDLGVMIKLGVISDHDGDQIDVGNSACSGLWSIRDASWINKESTGVNFVPTYTLGTLLQQWLEALSFSVSFPIVSSLPSSSFSHPLKRKIQIMKMDIEGNEIIGLSTILPYIQYSIVQTFILELIPDRLDIFNTFNQTKSVFVTMYENGYICTTGGKIDMTIENVLHFFNPKYKFEREEGISPTWICTLGI